MGQIYRVRRNKLDTVDRDEKIIDPKSDAHTNSTAFEESEIKPNPQIRTNRRFREPETMLSDFRNNLMEDKPFVNYTYELVHDWYARQRFGYEKVFVRAQQTPIDWKSKIGNSDLSTNFKTTHETKIYKGDIVIREDGIISMLTWNVTYHCKPGQRAAFYQALCALGTRAVKSSLTPCHAVTRSMPDGLTFPLQKASPVILVTT